MAARLKEQYMKEVRKRLQDEFQIKNPMAVPKIEKVVLNMGMGEAIPNAKLLDTAVEEPTHIHRPKTGFTKTKKSIANLKLRQREDIRTHGTLRGGEMC